MLTLLIALTLTSQIGCRNLTERSFNRDCGQVFTEKNFIIESTAYPSNYPTNHQCSYLIKGPTCPTQFTLQLLDFNLEESLGCAKDRLEIDDKDALCGNTRGTKSYHAKNGALILRFVSDSNTTGRGYRILVSRSDCTEENEANQPLSTTLVPKWYTTSKDVEFTTARPVQNGPSRHCCKAFYSEKQFTFTSPNYPYSMSSASDCSYEIRKASRNVCRLRLHFQFFFLARHQSTTCPEGYLQIDGKYVCGCKSDLNLVAPFVNDAAKIIRFVSRGMERNSFSGFVVNVIQDECPIRTQKSNDLNDEINNIPNSSHEENIQKLNLIRENTEVLPGSLEEGNSIVKHFYYFGDEVPEKEDTTYVDTSLMEAAFVPDYFGFGYCREWNQRQFFGLREVASCRASEDSKSSYPGRKCVDLGYTRGYLQTPGYPFYYPPNRNICYRWRAAPGYCSVRLHMRDFNIEESQSCTKDYFMLANNKQRYCGNRLNNNLLTINMGAGGNAEMDFVSDAYYCGRGFFGTYEQIACPTYPINPVAPSTPGSHSHIPTQTEPVPCSRSYNEEVFTIEISGIPTCTFTIQKYRPEVCKVRLYFEYFDLFCASESIVINGMMYCGRLSGKTITINFEGDYPVIAYKRRSGQAVSGLRATIQGLQLLDECVEPEVPAERLLDPRTFTPQSNNITFLLKMDHNYKEICGVFRNVSAVDAPESFCDFLMQSKHNISECIPLKENFLTVPFESQKIELKIGEAETIEEIEFDEIDCEEMSTAQIREN